MSSPSAAHPPIISPEAWRLQRLKLLEEEKALTRQTDALAAKRRRLGMVKLTKPYTFEGPDGKVPFTDLFKGQQQLIVYHFMFDPESEKGCPGCTGFVNAMGDISGLEKRRSTFALISRAPYPKLAGYAKAQGWDRAWYSSFGSDFNYDFHTTIDSDRVPAEYNYKDEAELRALFKEEGPMKFEAHAFSVFFRIGEDVFHSYSCYARGVETLTSFYPMLDRTPFGRQEDWEDSPEGWPQRPTYGGPPGV